MAETAASGYSQVPQKGREVEMTSPGKEAEDGVVPTASGNEDAICLKPKMSLLNGITVCIVATACKISQTHFLLTFSLLVSLPRSLSDQSSVQAFLSLQKAFLKTQEVWDFR